MGSTDYQALAKKLMARAKKKGAHFFQQARTFLFLTEEQVKKLRSGGGRINTLPAGWKAHLTPHYEVQ